MFKKLLTTRSLCLCHHRRALRRADAAARAHLVWEHPVPRVRSVHGAADGSAAVHSRSVCGLPDCEHFLPHAVDLGHRVRFTDDADCGVRHLRTAQEAWRRLARLWQTA